MATWRVYLDNKFVGYVVEANEASAMRAASNKYGSKIRVERTPI